MKRSAASIVLALACIGFVLPPVASAQMPREGKMRVLGHASIEAEPDYAVVRVGITTKAKTPTATMDENSAIARKIIDFAKEFGVDARDIRTQSVNLRPEMRSVRDTSGNVRQEPDGYVASNLVLVKIKEIARVGVFMRDVLDQGATNIAGVQFGLSNLDKLTDDARAKAVENAFHQAQRLAAAAKVKLGAVHEIVHSPDGQWRPSGHQEMAARQAAVPVESGSMRVTAVVEITWTIQ